VFNGGAGVSHWVLCEEGITLPGTLGIPIDSHGPTMGAVGMYATALGRRLEAGGEKACLKQRLAGAV
jgi:homoaconitase/3-isopropylmalate dehydratase large subunit